MHQKGSKLQPCAFVRILGHNHKHIILGMFFPGAKSDHTVSLQRKFSGEFAIGSKCHFSDFILPLNVHVKILFFSLRFSNIYLEAFDLKSTGSFFTCFLLMKWWFLVRKCLFMQTNACIFKWLTHIESAFVKVSCLLTNATLRLKVKKLRLLQAEQVATVTSRQWGAVKGVEGDQRASPVALKHLLSVWVKPIEIIWAGLDNNVFPQPVSC